MTGPTKNGSNGAAHSLAASVSSIGKVDLKAGQRLPTPQRAPALDRLLPHNIDMEQGLLGCQMLDSKLVAEVVRALGTHAPKVYYDLRHQCVQETLCAMAEAMQPIDVITVSDHLKDRQLLEQIGGIAYLLALDNAPPSSANWEYYLGVVKEKATLRNLIETCNRISVQGHSYAGDIETLLDAAEKAVLAVRPKRSSVEQTTTDLVNEAMGVIEEAYNGDGSITGLSTGFPDLDNATDGLHGGDWIVIGAYPGTGKTALAMNIAVHNALAGRRVVVYSYEMKPVKLMVRAICAESRVNFFDVRDKKVDIGHWQAMQDAGVRLALSKLKIKNATGMTIQQVRADARREKQSEGLELVVVDYIQIVEAAARQGANREREVADVSAGAKSIAMEHDVPVIGMSQLNDEGKLRESRAIGQDADKFWLLEAEGKPEPYVQPVRLFLGKGRDSVAGKSVLLTFLKTITKFESRSSVQEP